MNFFIIFCASLVSVSLGEPGWFDSLTSSDSNAIDNNVFAEAYSQTLNHVAKEQNKIQDQNTKRFNSLPKFEAGTLGGLATALISSTKNATGIIIHGVRRTTSEVTRALLETATNTGADLLLAQYKLVATTTGVGSNLSLPEIKTESGYYKISATGGYFRSLSSLEKNGRINVTIQDSETVFIEIPMRFTQMQVGYENITLNAVYFLTISGGFSIDVKNNSVSIKLRLGMDSTCAISVEEVKITELDGITVNLEKFGGYTALATQYLTNFLISYMKNVISNQIQKAVGSNLKETLNKNSMICSSFIPLQYT
uniref:Salivary secreted protein n=1 Tax=Triatoma infestans TaxID=30076 RepID=A6YPE0_TRIIF|nr:salivary secreted protein [Triatoma infestans]